MNGFRRRNFLRKLSFPKHGRRKHVIIFTLKILRQERNQFQFSKKRGGLSDVMKISGMDRNNQFGWRGWRWKVRVHKEKFDVNVLGRNKCVSTHPRTRHPPAALRSTFISIIAQSVQHWLIQLFLHPPRQSCKREGKSSKESFCGTPAGSGGNETNG